MQVCGRGWEGEGRGEKRGRGGEGREGRREGRQERRGARCVNWPEPFPSPPHLRRISAASPLHLRRISAASPLHLRRISAASPLHLRRISAASPPHLRCISAASPPHLRRMISAPTLATPVRGLGTPYLPISPHISPYLRCAASSRSSLRRACSSSSWTLCKSRRCTMATRARGAPLSPAVPPPPPLPTSLAAACSPVPRTSPSRRRDLGCSLPQASGSRWSSSSRAAPPPLACAQTRSAALSPRPPARGSAPQHLRATASV